MNVYLVTGDRWWGEVREDGREHTIRDDLRAMVGAFRRVPNGSILIHGNARGADRMARTHWPLVVHGPQIQIPYFGYLRRRGGPVRNVFMLDLLGMFETNRHNVFVWGFHRYLDESRGTVHCMTEAARRGFDVHLWPDDAPWPDAA